MGFIKQIMIKFVNKIEVKFFLGYISFYLRWFRIIFRKRNSVTILMYHSVSKNELSSFKKHISYLRKYYNFITPDEFHDFIDGKKKINGRQILISFDDGFKSSKYATEKILDPLGIKSIHFLPSGFIGLSEDSWKEYVSKNMYNNRILKKDILYDHKPMTWEDVNDLVNNDHSIGAHTISHLSLRDCMNNLLEKEILFSGYEIEAKINNKVSSFAYPFGSVNHINSESLKIMKKKYKYCYTGIRGTNDELTNRMAIFREAVSLDDKPNYVRFLVENGLGWYYRKDFKLFNKYLND